MINKLLAAALRGKGVVLEDDVAHLKVALVESLALVAGGLRLLLAHLVEGTRLLLLELGNWVLLVWDLVLARWTWLALGRLNLGDFLEDGQARQLLDHDHHVHQLDHLSQRNAIHLLHRLLDDFLDLVLELDLILASVTGDLTDLPLEVNQHVVEVDLVAGLLLGLEALVDDVSQEVVLVEWRHFEVRKSLLEVEVLQ